MARKPIRDSIFDAFSALGGDASADDIREWLQRETSVRTNAPNLRTMIESVRESYKRSEATETRNRGIEKRMVEFMKLFRDEYGEVGLLNFIEQLPKPLRAKIVERAQKPS